MNAIASSSSRGCTAIVLLLAMQLALAAGSTGTASTSTHAVAAPAMLSNKELAHADGEAVFRHVCQGCHMPDASGAQGAGAYPALAGDPRLASARFMAATVLFGRRNMPSFSMETNLHGFEATTRIGLGDAQVADVVNYVRSHFGNHYADRLTAADVAALHPSARSP